MIRYDPETNIVVMDLVNLEHCGFDWWEFRSELSLAGIDAGQARNPLAIIVNVAGGHVITPGTPEEERAQLARMLEARAAFKALLAAVGVEG